MRNVIADLKKSIFVIAAQFAADWNNDAKLNFLAAWKAAAKKINFAFMKLYGGVIGRSWRDIWLIWVGSSLLFANKRINPTKNFEVNL